MQQVETGSRFWWRALDAHTPEPVMSPAPRFTLPSTPRFTPQAGLTLQIPKSDRRARPRRKASKVTRGAVFAVLTLGAATAAAVTAVALPESTIASLREAIGASLTQAMISAGFGIDQVTLTGQRYTLDSDVFDALDLVNVKTFAALDTAAALKRIERIAWVDSAQMTRVFPGKLAVEIKERLPAAIWARGDKTYLIDTTGRTLGPLPQVNSWRLPRISGEGANTEAPLLLAAVARHKEIAARFSHAERIAERRWTVVLTNGTRIELGADREIEGLDHVAADSKLRHAMTGGAMLIDVRTATRAVTRSTVAIQQTQPARLGSAR